MWISPQPIDTPQIADPCQQNYQFQIGYFSNKKDTLIIFKALLSWKTKHHCFLEAGIYEQEPVKFIIRKKMIGIVKQYEG